MTVPDAPALTPEHLEDARLYADRLEMIRALVPAGPGVAVAEVGVGLGDFSVRLLEELAPSLFVGVDTFVLDQLDTMWDRPTSEIFGGLSHVEFYRRRLAPYGDRVEIEEGLSWDGLERRANASFDLVYVDAGHDYECVARDLDVAVRKVRPDGVVVANDYVLVDHMGAPYGVVQAVNRLVVTTDWRVVGLALHPQMYCDIALRQVPVPAAG